MHQVVRVKGALQGQAMHQVVRVIGRSLTRPGSASAGPLDIFGPGWIFGLVSHQPLPPRRHETCAQPESVPVDVAEVVHRGAAHSNARGQGVGFDKRDIPSQARSAIDRRSLRQQSDASGTRDSWALPGRVRRFPRARLPLLGVRSTPGQHSTSHLWRAELWRSCVRSFSHSSSACCG